IRHLRSRVGASIPSPTTGGAFGAIGTTGPTNVASNYILDHCSFAWAPDDTAGGDGAANLTIQWSIIAEGLGSPPNPAADPSKCGLWTARTGVAPTAGGSWLHNYMANIW